jgi:hypothetical protein
MAEFWVNKRLIILARIPARLCFATAALSYGEG